MQSLRIQLHKKLLTFDELNSLQFCDVFLAVAVVVV